MSLCHWLTWVERIESSTTRNGLKGAVMNVAFLFAIVSIGPTFILEVCAREPIPIPRPWKKLTTVYLGKGKGPNVCACHIDFRRRSKDIEHYPSPQMPTCESESEPQNVWTAPTEPPWIKNREDQLAHVAAVMLNVGDGVDHELKYGEGEYRWHCTEDSEYLK